MKNLRHPIGGTLSCPQGNCNGIVRTANLKFQIAFTSAPIHKTIPLLIPLGQEEFLL